MSIETTDNGHPIPHVFSDLTPDTVMDAVASCGMYPDGRLLALNSYENRVYQVGIEDALPVVVKFYRPARWSKDAILEEHAFTQSLADAEIPVVPPMAFESGTLLRWNAFEFSVFKRQGGRAPEFDQPDVLEWIGRFMGRIHMVGKAAAFVHRPAISTYTFGEVPRQYLLDHHFIPSDLLNAWTSVVNMAIDEVKRCFDRAGDVASIRLHGDCHAGTILWTDHGPHFVDFDDARMGPAVQDLWMLLSGSRIEMAEQLMTVLDGYEQFCDFNPRELHLIEALRTLRLIHYSAWLAQRWDDPAFPVAFPWFNTAVYWQNRILELKEQVSLMQEDPIRI